MSSPVRFSSSAPTQTSFKINNFYIGVGEGIAYGPTSATNFFASFPPATGEYVIYQKRTTGSPPEFGVLPSDEDGLIFYFKQLGYSVGETNKFGRALATASLQDDICVVNKDIEPIYPGTSTNKLACYLDGGYTPCYASGSDTVTAQGANQFTGVLSGTSSPEGDLQRYSAGNGGSISFDSSNRDKITTNLTNNSIFQSPFTMEFWVYVDGAQSNGTLFYKAPSNGLDNSLEINIASNGRINITVGADTRTSTAALTQDAWNLLSIQLTSNTNVVRINNGTVDAATRTAIGSALTNITSTAAVLMGSEGATNNFNGNIAIFSLYEGNLSQGPQLQNWNALKSRFGLS